MRLKRETQGAFCVLNAYAKSQTRKSMKINVICTVVGLPGIHFVPEITDQSEEDALHMTGHDLTSRPVISQTVT